MVTKNADVEVSGQTVKTCLIKHCIKLHTPLRATNYLTRDFNIAECETMQVGTERFKLKKSIAAIILLEILEEEGKKRK